MSNHVYIQDLGGISGSFSDPRVFLVTPEHKGACRAYSPDAKQCISLQNDDGPTYLIVGPKVEDDSLERASSRFDVPLADLVRFRDNQKSAQPPALKR